MSEPHEAKWISTVVPIKEVTAFVVFLSLAVSAKTSWKIVYVGGPTSLSEYKNEHMHKWNCDKEIHTPYLHLMQI
jgi:hypothetical protein